MACIKWDMLKFDKKTIHSGNLYQIHTYVMNKDKNHKGKVDGMLLYAKTDEDITPDGQMKLGDGNIIYFRTLDPMCPLNESRNNWKNISLI